MEESTINTLYESWELSENENKSNYHTVLFMSNESKLPVSEVHKFILEHGYADRIKWFIEKQNNY